jgi:hypothetical protein
MEETMQKQVRRIQELTNNQKKDFSGSIFMAATI